MRYLTMFLCFGSIAATTKVGDDKLFVAKPFTEEKSFTPGIEGPNCDAVGNIYLVSYQTAQNIGKVTPGGKISVFVTLPGKSAGNGIVFDKQGFMYIADYVGHNVM